MSHRSHRPSPRCGGLRWPTPAQHLQPAGASPGACGSSGAAIAWLPTLLAKGPQPLQHAHLRHAPPTAQPARLHFIVLDTSGSMRQRGRLALAKGHAAWLIEQAARAGDNVALLCFGGQGVDLRMPPRRARAAGSALVRPVGGGGGTPLAYALTQAGQVLRHAARQHGPAESWLWLLTDGRTLEQPEAPAEANHIVVVDFDDPHRPIGRCAAWAERWRAEHRRPAEPSPANYRP